MKIKLLLFSIYNLTKFLFLFFFSLVKNVLLPVVGYHNSPPFRAQCPCWHSFLSPIDVGPPPNPPPSRPNVLASTPPRVYPLWGTTSSLAHRLVSASDTICNGSDPLLAVIVLFGLSLSGFTSRFLKRVF